MACSSCGKARKRTMNQSQARQVASGAGGAPRYTVQAPDGTSKSFDRYLDAAIYKRQVNGVLTTST